MNPELGGIVDGTDPGGESADMEPADVIASVKSASGAEIPEVGATLVEGVAAVDSGADASEEVTGKVMAPEVAIAARAAAQEKVHRRRRKR